MGLRISFGCRLYCLPQIIRVKEPGEFWFNVDNMDVPLPCISNSCLIKYARVVGFNINPKRPKHLQLQPANHGSANALRE